MAQSTAALPGAEGIRSLVDDDAVFRAFDAYPWTRDAAFMSGLRAIVGPPNGGGGGSPADIATHARVFYYAQRIGVSIDFARYQAWLARNPDHQPPSLVPVDAAAAAAPDEPQDHEPPVAPLAWQEAAPKSELFVDRRTRPLAQDDEPNYPMGFAQMMQLLQEGKDVPGIRQIPNTIAREPSIKPVGARVVPRKPWERDRPPEPSLTGSISMLDADFPPAEGDASNAV